MMKKMNLWVVLLITLTTMFACTKEEDDDERRFPDFPATVEAEYNAETQAVDVSWSAVKEFETYNILRSLEETDAFEVIGWSNSHSFTDKKVEFNTSYYYKIQAITHDYDNMGAELEGNISDEYQAKVLTGGPNLQVEINPIYFCWRWRNERNIEIL